MRGVDKGMISKILCQVEPCFVDRLSDGGYWSLVPPIMLKAAVQPMLAWENGREDHDNDDRGALKSYCAASAVMVFPLASHSQCC